MTPRPNARPHGQVRHSQVVTTFGPGSLVVCDQLVDRTWGRADTFYEGPEPHHVSYADPYCPELSAVAVAAAGTAGITVHPAGTVVVIQGPRFSTRAESRGGRVE